MLPILPLILLLALAQWPGCLGLASGSGGLRGKKLNIVTILSDPFVMKKADKDGKDEFVGFYIDMLKLLQRELNFTYDIYEVADGRYGNLDGDGKWTGMIGDVVDKKANASLAVLRITGTRLKDVDFTVPMTSSGMSILYQAAPPSRLLPFKTSVSPAVLLEPFAPATWFLLLFMYILYTALAFALWLLSPYELNKAQTAAAADASMLSRAKKAGCGAWLFVSGGLFLQGFARAPKAPSARVLGFAWWLFSLASLSCYIANLVPLLSIQQGSPRTIRVQTIESLKDLLLQEKVQYGMLQYGATQRMFQESNLPLFKLVSTYLSYNPQNYVNSIAQAIERVKQGNYAFIGEGVSLDYHAAISCNLTSIPAGMSNLDFGMALAKGSELKPLLDDAILKIKENGELESLKARWWTKPYGLRCDDSDGATAADNTRKNVKAASLVPGDLVLLYVLLILGAIVAMATLPLELWLKSASLPSCSGGAEQTEAAATAAEGSGSSGSKKQHQPKNDDTAGATAAAAKDQKPPPESQPLV